MEINILVTCFNKENFADFFRYTIAPQFEKLKPTITLAYNGMRKFYPCDARIPNRGLQLGDYDLTLTAFKLAKKKNNVTKFLKISADIWPCDEDKIIEIFQRMEDSQCGYAGNYWFPGARQDTLCTDFFFVDTRFGNVFEHLGEPQNKAFNEIEFSMRKAVDACTKPLIIEEREPTHPTYRTYCEALKLTMEDDFVLNMTRYKEWSGQGFKIHQISSNPMAHGLGDTLYMTAVTQQEACLVKLPSNREELARLFRGQAYVSISDQLPGSPEEGNDLYVNRRLRAFNLDVARNIPFVGFSASETNKIIELRTKYPKAIIFKPTAAYRHEGKADRYFDNPTQWEPALKALKEAGFTIFQAKYSIPPYESPGRYPYVDFEIENTPLDQLCIVYAAFVNYFGADTGDHHLNLACGGRNVTIYPTINTGYSPKDHHYQNKRVKFIPYESLTIEIETIKNFFNE